MSNWYKKANRGNIPKMDQTEEERESTDISVVQPFLGSNDRQTSDGNGYPNGLKDEEISQIGRIVAVADVFDALTSDRPYRQALSAEEALDILHRDRGTHLDSQCVDAMINAYLKGHIKTQRERAQLEGADEQP